ncbi:hypothetical protein V1478_008656 [Vespula squamosa]|uniref:Uncharacterized protein n=1 Tax=Vespula squamosa TaxID=30214 RepID=A0ABD2AU49_VESSQ
MAILNSHDVKWRKGGTRRDSWTLIIAARISEYLLSVPCCTWDYLLLDLKAVPATTHRLIRWDHGNVEGYRNKILTNRYHRQNLQHRRNSMGMQTGIRIPPVNDITNYFELFRWNRITIFFLNIHSEQVVAFHKIFHRFVSRVTRFTPLRRQQVVTDYSLFLKVDILIDVTRSGKTHEKPFITFRPYHPNDLRRVGVDSTPNCDRRNKGLKNIPITSAIDTKAFPLLLKTRMPMGSDDRDCVSRRTWRLVVIELPNRLVPGVILDIDIEYERDIKQQKRDFKKRLEWRRRDRLRSHPKKYTQHVDDTVSSSQSPSTTRTTREGPFSRWYSWERSCSVNLSDVSSGANEATPLPSHPYHRNSIEKEEEDEEEEEEEEEDDEGEGAPVARGECAS